MRKIQFTLFDSNNFYLQGLRLLLEDYLHALNECHHTYPQLASEEPGQVEIVLRTLENRWGCACCYQSQYQTPPHRRLNIVILDDSTQHYIQTYPLLLSIYRRDSTNVICNKLHEALTHFCQQPWLDLHVGNMWKCQQCRIAALSNCEKKVLRLMSTGMAACTIANMLHRSQKTISTHKRSAMRKLNLRKNAELSRVLLNQMGLN